MAQIPRRYADVEAMTRLRERIPASALAKARLITATFASVAIGAQVTQVGNVAHGRAWNGMSAAAMLIIVAIVIVTHRRGRALWLDPVVLPLLLVAAGSGLVDSVNTTGLCIGVLIAQSMYGSHRAWLIRAAGATVALPVAITLSPFALDRPIEWNSPTVLPILPQLVLIATVIRAMCVALVRQEQSNARESVLAQTGGRLLAVTDITQARVIGAEAFADLAALSPGIVAAMFAVQGHSATVTASAGFSTGMTGTVLSAEALTDLAAAGTSAGNSGLTVLSQHAPGVRHWRGTTLISKDSDRFLIAGGARRVADGVFDAFLNLSNQVALAEASCASNAELHHQAHHDHLTTLPTRALFFSQLVQAIDAGTGTVGLLNIDLDDFKKVNDVYGHGAGDELLVEVATRLIDAGGPNSIAARFGGDEFSLLLTDVTDPDDAVRIAERICQRIIEPVRLSAATVSIGASIGAVTAGPGMTAGDLVRCADIAMYSAKARGKNRVEIFTFERHGDISHHRMLEEHLGEATARGEIVLLYQPLVDLRTGRCAGVEALAYWQHPTLGLVSPADLLPLAERTGQITALGTHILTGACRQMAEWVALWSAGDARIGVNVNARQVLEPGFARAVADILRESGLAADRLTLEVVESEHMDDENARAQLRAVAAMGVRIALDDFGTGYSSLASLRSFPIHQIKIDSSFLASGDLATLKLVISVGELLGTETVVLGLTTAGDADELLPTNVVCGQGDLLGEPMPANEFERWLSARAVH